MLCTEFDPDRKAVVNPEECITPVPGFPEICVFPFSKHIVQQCLSRYQGEAIASLAFCTGREPIYRMEIDGVTLAMGLPHVDGPVWDSGVLSQQGASMAEEGVAAAVETGRLLQRNFAK